MNSEDQKLIEIIAEQVLEVLRRRQGPGAEGREDGPGDRGQQETGGRAPRDEVRPPIGVCTGDYSQFPELQKRRRAGAARPAAPPLTGIVTAEQLQRAMDTATDGVVHLADDARLTPLANDLAREHPQRVRRGGRPIASPPAYRTAPSAKASCGPVLTGIVTAEQLQHAADTAGDGVAQLADSARLTPLANDWAREHPQRIRRVES